MEYLKDIIFYSLDHSVRSYRQFAQKRLKDAGFTITIDQWLVLKAIEENDTFTQQQVAEIVFKDVASVTRIIEMLVKAGYLSRDFHPTDRRRFDLQLTQEGKELIEKLKPYTKDNRAKALEGVSQQEIKALQETLHKIINNVKG